MSDGSRVQKKMTAGLDLGDRYSYLGLIDDESGEIVEEGRLRTIPDDFHRRFNSARRPKIAIEVGTHSTWVSRLLEECGQEVLVANPRKVRLIYGGKRKTDKLDAKKLARLARADPELLYPIKHRSEESQTHLDLIHSRDALVRNRTQLINHVRGTVKSFGDRRPRCSAESFHKKIAGQLPSEFAEALGEWLRPSHGSHRHLRLLLRSEESLAAEHEREYQQALEAVPAKEDRPLSVRSNRPRPDRAQAQHEAPQDFSL